MSSEVRIGSGVGVLIYNVYLIFGSLHGDQLHFFDAPGSFEDLFNRLNARF